MRPLSLHGEQFKMKKEQKLLMSLVPLEQGVYRPSSLQSTLFHSSFCFGLKEVFCLELSTKFNFLLKFPTTDNNKSIDDYHGHFQERG